MLIGELSRRTDASVRSLRYYEEQGLLRSVRDVNGYRDFGDDAVDRVLKIRGLLDAGIPTRIIRAILPCLNSPGTIHMRVVAPETLAKLEAERVRLQRRIEALCTDRDAIDGYLFQARPRLREPGEATVDGA